MNTKVEVEAFFDRQTFTLTYVVYDPETRDAVVIDPVLDYDVLASRTYTDSFELLASFIEKEQLKVHYSLDTHAHADHLSGSQLLRRKFGAKVGIGANISIIQSTFKELLDLPKEFRTDGSQFDRLIKEGEVVHAGSIAIEAIATPGHTPACLTYKIGDAIFTGDALFIEDYGTGRCDFPKGSADDLYTSVHDKLYALPDSTRVFPGHDYLPDDRELRYESTIGVEKRENKQLKAETSREAFVEMRRGRDATLSPPRLIFQSIQVNVDAGRLPPVHSNGKRYLTIPLNLSDETDETGFPLKEKR
ncbi:MAG: MBL fold metallo-hydrolase [Polyangiaceae bacterium]|nr:MBL fold metallo-hydrolase [Polyangiaceae bacterium]